MVGQNSSRIIFDCGIQNTVNSHDCSGNSENVKSCETAGEHINGCFCCKGAKEYCTGDSCLRISIGKPCMQRDSRSVYTETEHNHVIIILGTARQNRIKNKIANRLVPEQYPCQQEKPAKGMKKEITKSCPCGNGVSVEPDQKCGGNRHQFPEYKQ